MDALKNNGMQSNRWVDRQQRQANYGLSKQFELPLHKIYGELHWQISLPWGRNNNDTMTQRKRQLKNGDLHDNKKNITVGLVDLPY